MDPTQAQFEEAVLAIIQGIYNSTLIPESHKQAYVDHIKKNGITEKMLTELKKILDQEKETLNLSIEEKKKLITELQKLVQEEQAKINVNQAEMLAAYEQYTEKQVKGFEGTLGEIEAGISEGIEEAAHGAEKSQEDAIRSKLQSKTQV